MEMDVLQHENNDLKIMTEKGDNKPLSEQDAALQEFITTGIDCVGTRVFHKSPIEF